MKNTQKKSDDELLNYTITDVFFSDSSYNFGALIFIGITFFVLVHFILNLF